MCHLVKQQLRWNTIMEGTHQVQECAPGHRQRHMTDGAALHILQRCICPSMLCTLLLLDVQTHKPRSNHIPKSSIIVCRVHQAPYL